MLFRSLIDNFTKSLEQATAAGATNIADEVQKQLLTFIAERDKQAENIKAMQELLGIKPTVDTYKTANTAADTFKYTDEAGKVFTGDIIDSAAKSAGMNADLAAAYRYRLGALETGGTASLDDILDDLFNVTDEVSDVSKNGSAFKR